MDDWRVQAAATLASELPAAYEGGPSFKPGAQVHLSSVATDAVGQPVGFVAPSALALALSISVRASKNAEDMRPNLHYDTASSPQEVVKQVRLTSTGALFDFFEQYFISATFSFQALEAFSNYEIAYGTVETFELMRGKGPKLLARDELEMCASTEEKISVALPVIFECPSPKGRKEWEHFVRLKRLRDATVHIKSPHQWTSSDRFEQSPYALAMRQSALEAPRAAIAMMRYFDDSRVKKWLDEAQRLLAS